MSSRAHEGAKEGLSTVPHEPMGDPPAVAGWIGRALGIPLFHKLLLAHVAITIAAVALTATIAIVLRGTPRSGSVGGIVLWAAFGMGVSTMLNALLIHSALVPIHRLQATADKVGHGHLDARAEYSALADRSLTSLTRTFNRMLDRVEGARRRERDLASRVLAAEERERDRLAGELYAGPCQTLAGLGVRLHLAARGHQVGNGLLEELRTEVGVALEEVRDVARRLSPPELNELGIQPALEAHARRITDDRLVRVSFRGQVPQERLTLPVRVALFRIVREALSNAVTHARASRINVGFQVAAAGLDVEITDDGMGFDAAAVMSAIHGNVGLLGMRERAVYAGGTLRVDSDRGEGTTVRAVLPLLPELDGEHAAPSTSAGGPLSYPLPRALP